MQPRFKNGTNFSCYESLPKGYSECVQYPSPQKKSSLGSPVKIAFRGFLFKEWNEIPVKVRNSGSI